MKYLIDTHVWIWFNSRPEALSVRARNVIQSGDYEGLLLSAISIWELAKLVEKGRLTLAYDTWKWIEEALDIPKLELAPLSPRISWSSTCLPPPFHDDPADQILVATAREENAAVITADRLIRDYPHVRSVW